MSDGASSGEFHRHWPFAILFLCTSLWIVGAADGQTYTVLHNFGDGPNDGAYPYSSLTDVGSVLYGTTDGGGANDMGTLFSLNASGGNYNTLYIFGSAGDGQFPLGGLIDSGNTLYGNTQAGGASGNGTIFSFDMVHNTEAVAYSFPGGSGGQTSTAPLLNAGSIFFGTTMAGGSANGGTLFSFNPANNATAILHSFTGASNDGSDSRYGALVPSGTTLYGMTSYGGASGDGAIYSFNTTTSNLNVLHSFTATAGDGFYPEGGLTQSGTILYGTTAGAGSNNDGILFSYNTSDNIYSILHEFDGTDGDTPVGTLVQSGSLLYGMTENGGASGDGEIYSFNTTNNSVNVLYSFDGSDGADPYPNTLLLMNDALYGMTSQGGTNGEGVIFSLSIPEPGALGLLCVASLSFLTRRRTPASKS
jgi:uncharacterized repeat protein (TIGR03803 family)